MSSLLANRLPPVTAAPTPTWLLPPPTPQPTVGPRLEKDRRAWQRSALLSYIAAAQGRPLGLHRLRELVRGTRQEIEDALRILVDSGQIRERKTPKNASYALAKAGV